MAQIISVSRTKSASHKPYSRQQVLAAELETLMRFLKGDTKTRYKHAKRILRTILNSKIDPDSPMQKALLEAANEVGQSYPRPSAYPNVTSTGNTFTDTSKDKPAPQSQWPDKNSCIQAGVNSGKSLAESTQLCEIYFPPGPKTVGGIEKRKAAGGSGFSTSSTTTTYYPNHDGFKKNIPKLEVLQAATSSNTKSASIGNVPYHVWSYMTAGEVQELETRLTQPYSSNIKSAAQRESMNETLSNDAAYAVGRIREQRQARKEERTSRLRQASLSEKPSWLLAYESINGEVYHE